MSRDMKPIRERKKETSSENSIAKFAQKAGQMAIKKSSRNKIVITLAKDGHIYKIHPDGREVKGRALPKKVKVSQQIITIP